MKKALFTRTRILSAVLLVLFIASCNQGSNLADNTRRWAVDPVLQNDVPFQDFTINTDKNDTIALAEGTKIFLPSGIFVDAAGKPVKGDVQIHYRSFYTPGEIVASGISMFYDSANAEHIFSSAGMFEIKGTQNGNPISIGPGKSIDMDFASSRDDATYSFYQMDTAKAEWKYITTGKKAEPNALREELTADLSTIFSKPVEPKLYDATKPIINIDVDVANHPELAGYEGLLWQYAGSGTNPEKNKWIYDTDWNSAQLTMKDENTCMYGLNLSGSGKKFSTNVFPALKGNDYKQAMTEFREKMDTFTAKENVRQEKRRNVALTTRFQRRTGISMFGIFNWDMFFGCPDEVFAEFHFDDPIFEKNRENVAVYFVAMNGRAVSAYNGAGTPKLQFSSERKSYIIGILRETNKVCVLDNDDFLAAAAPERGEHSIFKLHSSSKTVANSKELDALIDDL